MEYLQTRNRGLKRMQGSNIRYPALSVGLKYRRTGAFLAFIAINMRFVSGNILNALIFFNVLQSRNPAKRFDIHTPSLPDIYGDVVILILLACAYFYLLCGSAMVADAIRLSSGKICTQYLTSRIRGHKIVFSLSALGLILYFTSRYVLSPLLEVAFPQDITGTSIAINITNDVLRLCSPLILVHAYCKYLSAAVPVVFVMYVFFGIRNLLATNVLGFVTGCDLHVGAPFLDILSPTIILYSMYSVFHVIKGISCDDQQFVKNVPS